MPPGPRVTPFDCLPAGTPLRRSTKRLLVQLSIQLEREARRLGDTCVVGATFQHARHFTPDTARRYAGLAAGTAFTCVLGEGLGAEPPPGLRGAPLAADDPVADEWDVTVLSPHFSAALLARDLRSGGPDGEREFELRAHLPARDRGRGHPGPARPGRPAPLTPARGIAGGPAALSWGEAAAGGRAGVGDGGDERDRGAGRAATAAGRGTPGPALRGGAAAAGPRPRGTTRLAVGGRPRRPGLRDPAAYTATLHADPALRAVCTSRPPRPWPHRRAGQRTGAGRADGGGPAQQAYLRASIDVTMKGGTTSGVIYPLALCEIARDFRLRNVGGASAGAIAASFAAAAEVGRATAVLRGEDGARRPARAGQLRRGFAGLADVIAWLARSTTRRAPPTSCGPPSSSSRSGRPARVPRDGGRHAAPVLGAAAARGHQLRRGDPGRLPGLPPRAARAAGSRRPWWWRAGPRRPAPPTWWPPGGCWA